MNQEEMCSVNGAQKQKLSKMKREKALDLESKSAKLTDFFTQVPQHDILIPDQNQSPSSEVDPNTSLVTSNQNMMTLKSLRCHSRFI